jgi:hypothetical protein
MEKLKLASRALMKALNADQSDFVASCDITLSITILV